MRTILGALALAMLAACSSGQAPVGEEGLPAVRAAITAQDFAKAADLARAFAKAHPHDADAQFELARAEALLSNQGSALTALDAAISAGLANARVALDDPAFDGLRDNARFMALGERASPSGKTGQPREQLGAGSGPDRVDIATDSAGHTHIQAGDVSLNTDF